MPSWHLWKISTAKDSNFYFILSMLNALTEQRIPNIPGLVTSLKYLHVVWKFTITGTISLRPTNKGSPQNNILINLFGTFMMSANYGILFMWMLVWLSLSATKTCYWFKMDIMTETGNYQLHNHQLNRRGSSNYWENKYKPLIHHHA